MKINLVLIAIFNCVFLCAQHSSKASFRGGFKLGFSYHTLQGDLTKSGLAGDFLGGFWFQLKMNEKWTAQTELLLLDKGIGDAIFGKQSQHQVNLHYFEIPVLFQYNNKNVYFEFGPGLGYLIRRSEQLYGNVSPELVFTYPFSRNELSFNVGVGWKLNEKWVLGLRLSHSLLPVRAAVPLVSKVSYNRLLAFNLTRRLMKTKASDSQD